MTERFKFVCDDENCFFTDNGKGLDCYEVVELLNTLNDENEQLRKKITEMENQKEINCRNCEYFISDKSSSDCLKREDIGYKGTCIDGMDLHKLARDCPYY